MLGKTGISTELPKTISSGMKDNVPAITQVGIFQFSDEVVVDVVMFIRSSLSNAHHLSAPAKRKEKGKDF